MKFQVFFTMTLVSCLGSQVTWSKCGGCWMPRPIPTRQMRRGGRGGGRGLRGLAPMEPWSVRHEVRQWIDMVYYDSIYIYEFMLVDYMVTSIYI